jgi:hypothetical protein
VPVIVNCVLNHHHFVVDIVAFVSKGDFPRSRLGEKQRGKILASWVTRKMRTIAQFAIRDPIGEEGIAKRTASMVRQSVSSGTLVSQSRGSLGSKHSYPLTQQPTQAQYMATSLQHNPSQSSHSSGQSLPHEFHTMSLRDAQEQLHNPAALLPQNELHLDLPATYPTTSFLNAVNAAELPTAYNDPYNGYDDEETPTASPRANRNAEPQRSFVHELSAGKDGAELIGYSPYGRNVPAAADLDNQDPHHLAQAAQNLPGSLLPPAAIAEMRGSSNSSQYYGQQQSYHRRGTSSDEDEALLDLPLDKPPPLPSYVNKPYLSMLSHESGRDGRLPSGSLPSSPTNATSSHRGNGLTVVNPSPSPQQPSSSGRQLRVANRDSINEDGEWPSEALMHMGIASAAVKRKPMPDAGR